MIDRTKLPGNCEVWESDGVCLIRGDSLEVLSAISEVDAVVTDPPYGGKYQTNYKRFTSGGKYKEAGGRAWTANNSFPPIIGDDRDFDPQPWLAFPRVAMWGYHHFASRLPVGGILVWTKRREQCLGTWTSDAELCWISRGYGVFQFSHIWAGADRESERGQKTQHATQKPIAVMEWTMRRLRVEPGEVVLDPYMGSGTTGIACINSGNPFVGIEKDSSYFEIAKQRIIAAQSAKQSQLIA